MDPFLPSVPEESQPQFPLAEPVAGMGQIVSAAFIVSFVATGIAGAVFYFGLKFLCRGPSCEDFGALAIIIVVGMVALAAHLAALTLGLRLWSNRNGPSVHPPLMWLALGEIGATYVGYNAFFFSIPIIIAAATLLPFFIIVAVNARSFGAKMSFTLGALAIIFGSSAVHLVRSGVTEYQTSQSAQGVKMLDFHVTPEEIPGVGKVAMRIGFTIDVPPDEKGMNGILTDVMYKGKPGAMGMGSFPFKNVKEGPYLAGVVRQAPIGKTEFEYLYYPPFISEDAQGSWSLLIRTGNGIDASTIDFSEGYVSVQLMHGKDKDAFDTFTTGERTLVAQRLPTQDLKFQELYDDLKQTNRLRTCVPSR